MKNKNEAVVVTMFMCRCIQINNGSPHTLFPVKKKIEHDGFFNEKNMFLRGICLDKG